MAGKLSNYAQVQTLNWLLGQSATRPAGQYVGLSSGAPTSLSGSELTGDAGYARESATFAAANNSNNLGMSANASFVVFGPFSASHTFSGVTIWDSAAAGNLLWFNTFASPITVAVGSTLEVPASALVPSFAPQNIAVSGAQMALDWLFGGSAPTQPSSNLYMGLSSGPFSNNGNEAAFVSYARQPFGFSPAASLTASGCATAINSVAASFSASASEHVYGWQLWAAIGSSNSGTMLFYGVFGPAATITAASYLVLSAGSSTIWLE